MEYIYTYIKEKKWQILRDQKRVQSVTKWGIITCENKYPTGLEIWKNSNPLHPDSAITSRGTGLRLTGIHFILFLSYGLFLISIFTSLMTKRSHPTTLDSDCSKKNITVEVTVTICHLVVSRNHTRFLVQAESKCVLLALDYMPWKIWYSSLAKTFTYFKQVTMQNPAHLLSGQ